MDTMVLPRCVLRVDEGGTDQPRTDSQIELHVRPDQPKRAPRRGKRRHRFAHVMAIGPIEKRTHRDARRRRPAGRQRQPPQVQIQIVDVGEQ